MSKREWLVVTVAAAIIIWVLWQLGHDPEFWLLFG